MGLGLFQVAPEHLDLAQLILLLADPPFQLHTRPAISPRGRGGKGTEKARLDGNRIGFRGGNLLSPSVRGPENLVLQEQVQAPRREKLPQNRRQHGGSRRNRGRGQETAGQERACDHP
jgi:hypothetical protein